MTKMPDKKIKLSRKQRDEIRRKKEILDSAMSVFASQGFHGTTMAMISQASQYPLGTIYKYFTSKKQIYNDLVMEKIHDLGKIFFRISQRDDITPTTKLNESLFAMAKFYKKNNEFIRIYIAERSSIDSVVMPRLNENVNKMHEKMVDLFRSIFEQGKKTNEFKNYPEKDMAVLFSDIAHSASWSSLFTDESEKEFKQRLNIIFKMFTRGISNIKEQGKKGQEEGEDKKWHS